MVVTKYLTVLSGKYPVNLYRIPDSAGCLNFTGYRIPVSGSGTSLLDGIIRLVIQGCYNKPDTVMIKQECYKVDDTRL
jgi:hypothetical protein